MLNPPNFSFQGRLGDCWFLSAVAVLTEMSRISEVIITPEYNEEGIYTVRFCIQVFSLSEPSFENISPLGPPLHYILALVPYTYYLNGM
jgi:hypothetical protein